MNEQPTILDKISKAITIAGNSVLMNLLFLVCCIPVVTIGQAWCGLLSAVRYNIRGERWITGFKVGFKTRFWRGTIVWCILGAIDVRLLVDVINCLLNPNGNIPLATTIVSCVVFLLMAMVTFATQLLNVYVPTKLGDWLRNSVNMIFKVPLELAICAAAFWAAPLLCFYNFPIFVYVIMIFVTVFFVLLATCGTLLMKNALVHYLLDARAEGTLLSDDGKKESEEAAEEETNEETEEA